MGSDLISRGTAMACAASGTYRIINGERWIRVSDVRQNLEDIPAKEKEISDNDFATLCICAIRYCQGRRTYMPSLVQGIVSEHLEHIPDNDIYVMLRDCEYQENMQLYGDELIDKPGWIKWKEKLVAEKKRREKDGRLNQQTGSD